MRAPTPPEKVESKTCTWRVRVTEKERERVEKRASKEGWEGYSAWLRERLLWACSTGRTAPEPTRKSTPRTSFLTARFAPSDLQTLQDFAKLHGLDLSVWARSVALTPNDKLKRL